MQKRKCFMLSLFDTSHNSERYIQINVIFRLVCFSEFQYPNLDFDIKYSLTVPRNIVRAFKVAVVENVYRTTLTVKCSSVKSDENI